MKVKLQVTLDMSVYLKEIKAKRDRCRQVSCPSELDDAGRGVDGCLDPVS